MKRYILVATVAALPALAQVGGGWFHRDGPPGPGLFRFGSHEVVTGTPYTANFTNTIVQRLADGNTIERSNSGQVARDSQGRTFEQHTIKGGPLAPGTTKTVIFISDPVAGYAYHLDPDRKVAIRRHIRTGGPANESGGDASRIDAAPPKNPASTEAALSPDTSTGVYAEGKLITHTIPAGALGNAQPIVSTVERWYSPDLKIVVKSIRKDPRSGEATYVLSNITRSEPNASLFQVPSDYDMKDAPGRR